MASHASAPAPLLPEDVLDLPLPDGVIGYELVNGQPVPVMPASLSHARMMAEVARLLGNHVEACGIAGVVYADAGFVLGLRRDPHRMRGPDVAFVAEREPASAEHAGSDEGFGWFAPDLAVEIELSSGRKPGGRRRIGEYLEAGVRLVWAIHGRRRAAMVYRSDGSTTELDEDGVLDGEGIVPGFRLRLADLFRRSRSQR